MFFLLAIPLELSFPTRIIKCKSLEMCPYKTQIMQNIVITDQMES